MSLLIANHLNGIFKPSKADIDGFQLRIVFAAYMA